MCETCCEEIATTCCKNDNDKVLVKEMECSVLQESNEKLHKSLRHVIEEKDHVISQQDMVITSLKDAIVSKNATITEKDNINSQQNDVSSTLRNDYESETIESESEEDSEGSASEYEDSENLKTGTTNGIINDEDTTARRLIEEKEHSIIQQETLITSLKETVNIVKNKINDQDDVISQQAHVITVIKKQL